MTSTDPKLTALLVALSNLLKAVGVLLAGTGYFSTGVISAIAFASSAVLIVGPLVWDFWQALQGMRTARAQGVQAGINLAVLGQAVDSAGKVISKFEADATPPKPVTLATADVIIKDFAPAPATIAKS